MRWIPVLIVPIAAVLVLAVPAYALDQVIMKDGTTHRAEIVSVVEDGINVRFSPKSGGRVQMKVGWRRLDPHFFYNLRREQVGDDAKEHLKLAMWCIDAGLFSRAKVHVERAAELDPQLVKDIQEGKLPEVREKIAKRVLESAERDMKDENYENAEKKLEALLARMPDTEAGSQAREIYDDLQTRFKEYQAKQEQEELDQMAEEERKQEEALRKRVEPIKKDLEKAKEFMSKGLTEDNESRSLSLLGNAISRAETGLKKIDKLLADFPDDADLAKRADEVRAKVIAGMVRSHVHRADIYTWRGALNNSKKELEKARALDPDSPDIAQAEQRIDDRGNQDVWDLRWRQGMGAARQAGGSRFGGGGGVSKGGGGGRGGGGGGRR